MVMVRAMSIVTIGKQELRRDCSARMGSNGVDQCAPNIEEVSPGSLPQNSSALQVKNPKHPRIAGFPIVPLSV